MDKLHETKIKITTAVESSEVYKVKNIFYTHIL